MWPSFTVIKLMKSTPAAPAMHIPHFGWSWSYCVDRAHLFRVVPNTHTRNMFLIHGWRFNQRWWWRPPHQQALRYTHLNGVHTLFLGALTYSSVKEKNPNHQTRSTFGTTRKISRHTHLTVCIVTETPRTTRRRTVSLPSEHFIKCHSSALGATLVNVARLSIPLARAMLVEWHRAHHHIWYEHMLLLNHTCGACVDFGLWRSCVNNPSYFKRTRNGWHLLERVWRGNRYYILYLI